MQQNDHLDKENIDLSICQLQNLKVHCGKGRPVGTKSSHGNFSNQDKEFICECVEEYLKTIGKIKWKQLQKRMQKDRCVPCSQIDLKNGWNLKYLREGGAEAPDEEVI
ncbi:3823_t:CDS:2 [Funneliformis caledonium]|uniref:3823_t:CDS:1 n=1 Tax=Funneliformis caledonium TaxID=1117310 RepID=A0A9N8UZM1_9GLOM|nr:3823_t:CDS:2 [Funneliformis caledonium]